MTYIDISTKKEVNANVYVNELLMARIEELEDQVGRLKVDNMTKDNANKKLQRALEEAFDSESTFNWN